MSNEIKKRAIATNLLAAIILANAISDKTAKDSKPENEGEKKLCTTDLIYYINPITNETTCVLQQNNGVKKQSKVRPMEGDEYDRDTGIVLATLKTVSANNPATREAIHHTSVKVVNLGEQEPNKEDPETVTKDPEIVAGERVAVAEYSFKDGSKHILDDAGRNGILVFRDAISEARFDDKSDYSGDYSKSTVKVLIEKWWEDNAPNELKEKYDVALLSAEEVFSQEELDAYYDGSGKKAPKSIQLPLFANDWRNKCKNISGKKHGTWWWLRTQSPWICCLAALVGPAGTLYGGGARYSYALVPACYPKNSPLLNASGASSAKGKKTKK